MDSLCRALGVPDATTAVSLSPRPCLGRAVPWLMSTFTGGGCTDIHIPCVVWRSAGVHVKFHVWRVGRGVWFA